MSEQTTPRTVEEAAREEAERRTRGGGTVAHAMLRQEFVAGASWQAARMPSVADVAEVLAAHPGGTLVSGRCECGVYVSQDYARRWHALREHRAERVVALWGGGERG